MSEVLFNYEGIIISIQCNLNDKMKNIINKFLMKIKQQEDNDIYYLYNGTKIKDDLSFMEQANELDKNRKKMNIIVYNTKENEKKPALSTDIIFPECKEDI